MARASVASTPLSFVEIVMRADADTIRAALEARVKVDELLIEREQSYRRIAELEGQVEELMGEPGVFVFPPPPLAVADFDKRKASVPKKPTSTVAPAVPAKVSSKSPSA